MLPTIWFYLDKLGQQHSDKFGHILVEQLADQARQPILYEDKISLQVLVNRVVNNSDDVIKATIFDVDNALQVQSNNTHNNNHLDDTQGSVYRYPIKLEGSSAGFAQLSIDSPGIKSNLQALLWPVALIWIVFSALLCFGLKLIGGSLALRLTGITSRLPNCQHPDNANEINRLEASIKPLLVKQEISDDHSHDSGSLTLTIYCENIERLKLQLSQYNYQRLLRSIDAALDCAIKLFDGTRLPGSQGCIHLNFSCDGRSHNTLLRAISCYLGISDLLQSNAPRLGSGLTLRGAIALTGAPSAQSQFEQDQQREVDLQQLVKTTQLADSWQLLISAALITDVDTDVESQAEEAKTPETNAALEEIFSYETFSCKKSEHETLKAFCPASNSEAISDASPRTSSQTDSEAEPEAEPDPQRSPKSDKDRLVLFKALNSDYQDTLTGQLAYLRSQLPTEIKEL